jgi:hypothetical protein
LPFQRGKRGSIPRQTTGAMGALIGGQMTETLISKMRRMVRFFDSVDETLNDEIKTFEQAEQVYDFAQADKSYRHNNDVVQAALGQLAPKMKYCRAELDKKTDDELFDIYMLEVGFFDMNGSMLERANMLDTLSAIKAD